jgi:adenylosuccinate synthase
VLDSLPTIRVCNGYRLHDAELDYPPTIIVVLVKGEPICEELPGWKKPTSKVRRFDQLPSEAQDYIARLCELTGARIGIVSVGPGREQIIQVNPLF